MTDGLIGNVSVLLLIDDISARPDATALLEDLSSVFRQVETVDPAALNRVDRLAQLAAERLVVIRLSDSPVDVRLLTEVALALTAWPEADAVILRGEGLEDVGVVDCAILGGEYASRDSSVAVTAGEMGTDSLLDSAQAKEVTLEELGLEPCVGSPAVTHETGRGMESATKELEA